MDSEICISCKLHGGADVAGHRITLWVAMVSLTMRVSGLAGGWDGFDYHSSLPFNFKECFPKSDWERAA